MSRRIFAKFAGTCSCGASVRTDDSIEYDFDAHRVVGCEACGFSGKAHADVTNINMRGVAAALRRREEKRRKLAAREGK